LPPAVIFDLKIHKNAVVTEDVPRTPLEELTPLQKNLLAGLWSGKRREGKERTEREGN